jgi:hypothetical protein
MHISWTSCYECFYRTHHGSNPDRKGDCGDAGRSSRNCESIFRYLPGTLTVKKVLDFARYPEWHTSFIQSLTVTRPSTETQNIQQGETVNAKIGGVKLVPIIKANTPTELSWYGSTFGGAFAGKHYFLFIESHVTPGGTTFVHGEDYDGWLSWIFGKGSLGIGRKNVIKMYEGYSRDLKKRAEARKKLKKGIAETQTEPWVKL